MFVWACHHAGPTACKICPHCQLSRSRSRVTERWRPHPLSDPQTLRTVFPTPSPTSSCTEVKHVTSRFQVQFQYLSAYRIFGCDTGKGWVLHDLYSSAYASHENQTGGSEGLKMLIRNKKCTKIFLSHQLHHIWTEIHCVCIYWWCWSWWYRCLWDTGFLPSCHMADTQDDFNALVPCESSNLKTVILKDSVRDVKQYIMKC